MSDQPNTNAEQPYKEAKREPVFKLPLVIVAIVAVLTTIHIALQLGGLAWQNWSQYVFAFIPARFGPGIFPQISGSAYWSMLTYGMLHADWMHLGFNSLWLIIFSKPVVLRLGTWRYLALLAISVVAGAIAGLIMHWGQFVVMVGISAGVSGMIAAAIPVMYAGNRQMGLADEVQMASLRPLRPLEIIQNRQALIFTLMWLVLTMFTATSQYLTGTAFLEERVIAWEAHLGGFIAGLISFYLLDRTRNSQ